MKFGGEAEREHSTLWPQCRPDPIVPTLAEITGQPGAASTSETVQLSHKNVERREEKVVF